MPRRALGLSGGGAKGSFQIGVLEELILNRGLDFQIFCGTSVGALNASFLAQARFDERPRESLNRLKVAFRSLRRIWSGTHHRQSQRLPRTNVGDWRHCRGCRQFVRP
jgi:predicted acylesterase/phospholipase RssA